MSSSTEALQSAERLANVLQQVRTGTAGWQWRRNAGSLELTARDAQIHDAESWRADLLACGEVVHLVRNSMIEDGWVVRTHLSDTAKTRMGPILLEITGSRPSAEDDELFAAVIPDPSDVDGADAGHVDARTVEILLRDAAVEHGARLTTLSESVSVDGPTRQWHGSVCRAISPGRVPDRGATTAVLSTISDDVEARLDAGAAWAEVQLTAASVGLEALQIANLDSAPCVPAVDERIQIVFRIGRPQSAPARSRERMINAKRERILTPGRSMRCLGWRAELPAPRIAGP